MEAGRVKFEGARDSSVIKRIAQIAEISVKGLSRIIIVWQKKARLGDWTCYKSARHGGHSGFHACVVVY